jgi:endonuclease/exonuclease/phosphatase family metal-dependent hydrolase
LAPDIHPSSTSPRAAQFLELRAFLGRMCAAAAAARLTVRAALVVGDLNAAAGSAEAAVALAALRMPHTVDLAEPHASGASCDDASFPLGAWASRRGAYVRAAAPRARLDYVLDASAAARRDRAPLRHAHCAVEAAIAEDDDEAGHAAKGEGGGGAFGSFGLLSDHAALLAALALPP